MGLLQRAIETYDANEAIAGVYFTDKEPLAPIGHTLTRAGLEITLNRNGDFVEARKCEKSEPKIIIPVTEDSASRSGTSANEMPHPLCDQVKYLTAENNFFIPQLKKWVESPCSHPFPGIILEYLEKHTLLEDVSDIGEVKQDELVCWRITGTAEEETACWKNRNLFKAYGEYYAGIMSTRESGFCMVSGEETPLTNKHAKGIIPVNGNAKLISSNDKQNFTYRGRFTEDSQAASVGFIASQKAHNVLRWLISGQGVREYSGNRVFLCWNPQGTVLPSPMHGLRRNVTEPKRKPSDYRDELQSTFMSFRKDKQLKGTEAAVLTAFDAATTGRLSVAYYNEISLQDFMSRMFDWDNHCCWYNGKYGIQAPNLLRIVDCAYGSVRGGSLETDDKIQRQHLQRLLDCKVNGGVFPLDVVKALSQRASRPVAYDESVWRQIVWVACAAIQKYNFDLKRGGDEMSWELNKKDRSFQLGRLLAVLERAEADYYYRSGENRQTNAIKYMSEFRQRPWQIFERINLQLHRAYLTRVEPWQAVRYEKLTGEIIAILKEFPEAELNKPLSDIYLMGYELQRNAFFNNNNNKSENETEEN